MPKKTADSLTTNILLRKIPLPSWNGMFRKFERIELSPRQVLYQRHRTIDHVFFPEEGVVSLVSRMKEGTVIEVGTVGKEGMVGLPVFLGATSSPLEAFAQVPGRALQVSTTAFKRELLKIPEFEQVLQKYTHALFTQLSQSVACNRLHPVEKRCARWLLTTADRVSNKHFQLTQDFLAQMLGVRRATVNAVLQQFQRQGLIEYNKGEMQILNRRRLEDTSCECYGIIKSEYEKIIGTD